MKGNKTIPAKYQANWPVLDSGSEQTWESLTWKGVLDIISRHEGEDSYDRNAPIWDELKARFPKITWTSKPDEEFRSLFRDFPGAWTRSKVITLDDHRFSLTPLGRQIVSGEIDPTEAFLRMMADFGDSETKPFPILASAFLEARRPLTLSELYWGVVRNYRPGVDDLQAALATQPDADQIGDTNIRRLKFLLKRLQDVNAIRDGGGGNTWIPWDYSTLQRLAVPIAPPTVEIPQDVSIRQLEILANTQFAAAGFVFPSDLVRRFATSLLAKRFLILTGLSGSGKTSIARAFARWMSHIPDQYAMIRVGANWTSGDVLLGYPDALNNSRYQGTQTIDLLLRAIDRPLEPHFLILDEMNLSHVERYFADFLSAIETPQDAMSLYSSNEEREGVPHEVFLPANLFIVGTVNVDETTFMFSPKVLDRANVIEFRTSAEVINGFLTEPRSADVEQFAGLGASFAPAFIAEASSTAEIASLQAGAEAFKAEIQMLFSILSGHDMEFGLRTAWEITRYLHFATRLAENADTDRLVLLRDCLDIQILQKLLPRIHGSRRRVEPSLRSLLAYCSAAHDWDQSGVLNADQILAASTEAARSTSVSEQAVPPTVFYGRSANKLHRMLQRCIRDGFVNFAEA